MQHSRLFLIAGIVVSLGILTFLGFWMQDHYLMVGFILIMLSMVPFFIRFESKKLEAKEIVLIAMLIAIAAISRVPFAFLPNIQPTSFVIILTGMVFGPEIGFMVGAMAALLSNLFLGQGPWTPWQMFAWGMMGLTAGLLGEKFWFNNKWKLSIFGFVWGFIFGWIMNLWFIFGFIHPITWKSVLGACMTSFYFDLLHALSNVFFIQIFAKRWIKLLHRIKRKYGLLNC
jgi:energy-coupling factor transport system substrate-specific component